MESRKLVENCDESSNDSSDENSRPPSRNKKKKSERNAPQNAPSTANGTAAHRSILEDDNPVFTLRRRRNNKKDIYESLDYEECENKLERAERKTFSYNLRNLRRFTLKKDLARWFVFILIGILSALLACTIDIVIEELSAVKYSFLQKTVNDHVVSLKVDLLIPYLFWILTSVVPVMIGSIIVTYVEPVAAGSGIPEVKCYLNGVKIPRIVRIKTLFVKAIGVITSVVGGLVGGKEGPMIHGGAVIASGISQGKSTTFATDFKIFRYFRNDHEKRDFVLGGAAAGVSAAFGAPIGGALFSLEEAASFWNQNLIWRTLVTSSISAFVLNLVLSAYHGLHDFTFRGLFNLGKFENIHYEYFELGIFCVMGVAGGLIGAFWNYINTRLNNFRRRYITAKWGKVLEAGMISLIGVTAACFMAFFINDCKPLGNDNTTYPVQMFCEDNEYNTAASLWFETPEASVKLLLHDPPNSHKILTLTCFTCIYFILSCVTFGLSVSLGIFIPNVLVGAAWGRLFAMIMSTWFPHVTYLLPGKYALVGAAAQLGGVLRMTISLSVILIETTGVDISFTFPLIMTLIIAKWVGDLFNHGIYDTVIKKNKVPLLPWECPKMNEHKNANEIMNTPVKCFLLHEKSNYVYDVLMNCHHNAFPIVEDVEDNNRSNGRVCGMILRSQIVVILMKKYYEETQRFWEKDITIEVFRNMYPRYPSIEDVKIHEDKTNYTINFENFMNPSIIRANELDSVPSIFKIFRALGLRHLVVVNQKNRITGIITRKDFLNHS